MKKIILLLLLLIGFTESSAQDDHLQNANWLFGSHAGLNFASGTVSPIVSSSETTNVASVSDSCGNLLFATDGNSVWRFKNGTPILLDNRLLVSDVITYGGGNYDILRQNVVIVPKPNHPSCFYIVTAPSCAKSPDFELLKTAMLRKVS